MKIAVTCENNLVFQHFGHSPEFAVFTVEDNKIISKEVVSSGDKVHCALSGLLQENKINTLICGGIGCGAINALNQAGIQLVGGASGNVDEVVSGFLSGTLKTKSDFHCHHHDDENKHTCGVPGCKSGKCR